MDPITAKVLQGIIDNTTDIKPMKNEKREVMKIHSGIQALKDFKFYMEQEKLRKVLESRKSAKN